VGDDFIGIPVRRQSDDLFFARAQSNAQSCFLRRIGDSSRGTVSLARFFSRSSSTSGRRSSGNRSIVRFRHSDAPHRSFRKGHCRRLHAQWKSCHWQHRTRSRA
jgi:hypothetical protein